MQFGNLKNWGSSQKSTLKYTNIFKKKNIYWKQTLDISNQLRLTWNFVFSVFFIYSVFFIEKVSMCKFRHNDFAAAKLSFWKMCIRKEFRRKNWSSFWSSHKIEKLLLLLYVFFEYFRDIYIRDLIRIFYPNHIDYQRFQH